MVPVECHSLCICYLNETVANGNFFFGQVDT